MTFVISIWNSSDMVGRIRTRTLVNAQWDSASRFSTERRLSAWEQAGAVLRPVNHDVLSIGAVIDVFYDGLWLPDDQVRPSGGYVCVRYGYTLSGGALQGYVGVGPSTLMLRATAGQVVESSYGYYCHVAISSSPPEWKQLPNVGLPQRGLG